MNHKDVNSGEKNRSTGRTYRFKNQPLFFLKSLFFKSPIPSILLLLFSINTLAIPLGTHSDDLKVEASIEHLNYLRPGLSFRKVLGDKGDCTNRNTEDEMWSSSRATCNEGEIAIAGGVHEVFNEACSCSDVKYGQTWKSFRFSDLSTTWYVLYRCAKVQAYAICVSEADL